MLRLLCLNPPQRRQGSIDTTLSATLLNDDYWYRSVNGLLDVGWLFEAVIDQAEDERCQDDPEELIPVEEGESK